MATIKSLFTISFVFIYLSWTERWLKFSDQLVHSVVKETIRKEEKQGFQVTLKRSVSTDFTDFACSAWTG